jgi:hypothetical protein
MAAAPSLPMLAPSPMAARIFLFGAAIPSSSSQPWWMPDRIPKAVVSLSCFGLRSRCWPILVLILTIPYSALARSPAPAPFLLPGAFLLAVLQLSPTPASALLEAFSHATAVGLCVGIRLSRRSPQHSCLPSARVGARAPAHRHRGTLAPRPLGFGVLTFAVESSNPVLLCMTPKQAA